MRIVHIAAGAGQMYCGACNRDMALIRGLMDRGHQVQVIPLYTPLRLEGDEILTTRIFMGGINAYLQQHSKIFQHTPAFIDRLLDHPGLLRWASKMAVSTSPSDLGAMTVSVLQGRDGRQRKELDRLIKFLSAGDPPDVFSITNSMLSGIAPALKECFDAPVICGLQGEDAFLRKMTDPYTTQALDLIRKHARHIDGFTASTHSYADEMAGLLDIDCGRIHVVRTGFDVEPYRGIARARREVLSDSPVVIGYLSVIAPPKGLDILVEAWIALAENHRTRLQVAGRVLNTGYYNEIRRQIRRAGLDDRFRHAGEVDFEGKLDFLQQCDIFCQPSRATERRGLAALEAVTSGVPVVLPDRGAFREIIERTGGGVLFNPEDPVALTERIKELLNDPERARAMARAGSEIAASYYSPQLAVADLMAVLDAIGGR
ncbi:MAG: glycosyltransferase family 4 protein [Armatimonadota bacterium]